MKGNLAGGKRLKEILYVEFWATCDKCEALESEAQRVPPTAEVSDDEVIEPLRCRDIHRGRPLQGRSDGDLGLWTSLSGTISKHHHWAAFGLLMTGIKM